MLIESYFFQQIRCDSVDFSASSDAIVLLLAGQVLFYIEWKFWYDFRTYFIFSIKKDLQHVVHEKLM